MLTDMALGALEMARFNRGTRLDRLICHTDAGSQFTSVRYAERIDEIGARPSIGRFHPGPVPVDRRAITDQVKVALKHGEHATQKHFCLPEWETEHR